MYMARYAQSSGLILLAGLALASATPAFADALDDIKKKGEITVGVKAEYKPFGFREASGELKGFEIDIANAIAKAIGVKAKFEPVQDATRLPFITQGRVDLVIATMNDTPERRRTVGILEPFYYASGASILAPKSAHLKDWEELRGKKVCATQGSNWNKPIEEKFSVTVIAFRGIAEAETALKNGECVGFLYGNTALAERLADPVRWGDYEAPLPTLNEGPWAMAVKLEEKDLPLGKKISELLVGWHKDGTLLALEKKWNLPTSPWLAHEHEKYKTGAAK
jgi:polar amino acid transport system substrate-binding protein